MQIKGKLCEDLGLKYPIFQGGMAYISTAELAAAASAAAPLAEAQAGAAAGDRTRGPRRRRTPGAFIVKSFANGRTHAS